MPEPVTRSLHRSGSVRFCKPDDRLYRRTTPIGNTRASAERFGRYAEAVCRLALRLSGYRVVAVRTRTPVGEIDIVARRGDILAMVEVKARQDEACAAVALPPRQRRRLANAAAAFLGRHPDLAGLAVRFDLMLVTPWRWPRHIVDAWRP